MNGTVALFLLFYFLLFAESTEALHPQGVWKAQWARNSWPGGRDSPRRSSEEGRSFLMKLTEKRDSVLITYIVLVLLLELDCFSSGGAHACTVKRRAGERGGCVKHTAERETHRFIMESKLTLRL